MSFQIMQVAIPKKVVERTATGSQYDVIRQLPVGSGFFVPCNEGESLDKCVRRVSGSGIRIAEDADILIQFRSMSAELATATFGQVENESGEWVDRTEGCGVFRSKPGGYNHRGPRTAKPAADAGSADVTF
jgi:hypothetical protein